MKCRTMLRDGSHAGIVCFVALLSGCAGTDALSEPFTAKQPPTGTVNRVEALWTDTVLRSSGQSVARGFAGRIYLFGNEGDAPIIAPGQLSIYTFNDTDQSAKPTNIWRFEADQLEKVKKKTPVGWSYQLWIPWEYGGDTVNCSLIVRYTAPDGRIVVSDPARVRLPAVPGAKTKAQAAVSASANQPGQIAS